MHEIFLEFYGALKYFMSLEAISNKLDLIFMGGGCIKIFFVQDA